MIKGIGIDCIETPRIEDLIRRKGERFIERTFTPAEQKYCREKKMGMYQSYGVRFAAKEAIFKMLGTGWRNGIGWLQVEVVTDSVGKPGIALHGKARSRCRELGIDNIYISLTHTEAYCMACAVGESADI